MKTAAVSIRYFLMDLKIAKRVLVMTLISVLLAPVILINPGQRVSARSRQSSPVQQTAPPSAPPEPFIMAAGDSSTPFITASLLSLSNVFSTPKAPEGLEIAKVPTFGSKLTSYLGSFFALFTGSAAKSAAPEAPLPAQPPASVDFDFDNDGKTDFGRWHPSTTEMKIKNSNGGSYSTFTVGSTSSRSAPGDFNGDDKTDAAVFLDGVWKYKTSTGGSEQTVNWGTTGDIPVAGDYDGDDITDFAVFRPSTNYWYVLKSTNGSYTATSWGTSGDILVPGDYDGDGKTDHAVFRPSDGNWYILGSTAGYYSIHWGIAVDIPVPADYDGDGKTDPAVFRPTTGDWYAYKSSTNNGAYLSATWGSYGDQPVPGDYDGDSKADFAIWRPTTGAWYVIKSSDSTYMFELLGIAGDTAVPSSYIKQIGSPAIGYDLNTERLKPGNATGGTNLYSRNFSWSTGLVGLPGRSGLDAGFGLSYNSLIWIKQGSSMVFDPDASNITPGFRFGFPVIEPVYYDTAKSKYAYMMVTPSGGRVEFRQTAVGNTYDTADSSYAQLVTTGASSPNDPAESITIKVTTTDGTQMSYQWISGAFRCIKIMDRNGNYITITYNGYGDLETVTDTLGRVVTVNYSAEKTPTSITQTWKNNNGAGSTTVTHNWARFEYTTIQIDTNFGSLNIFGPQDGTYVKVLQKVKRADDSYTTFDYNTWGQVKQINNYAADTHKLNHVAVNLPANASSSESDCPRFTETKSYVENFNGGSELTFNNSITTSQSYSLPGSISGTATKIQTWMTGHPDNLRTNTFVGGSGWNEGLPIATEDCLTTTSTCSDRKRWSWSSWTQDNTGVAYPLNPRVVESRVGDTSNVKKTTIDYRTVSSVVTYGLPETVKTYDTDLSTVLKQSYTEYNLDSAYTSRRIIGLPSKTEVSGRDSSGLNLISKMTYAYDEGNFSDSGLSQNISPVQHDNTNYSSSFIAGRGNFTSTTRWDVNSPTTSGYAVTSSSKYNTAGNVVSSTDPRGRVSKIFYADDWNDGVSRTTYAAPTTFTDSGGYSSTVKYRFDMGANVWARSPTPYSSTSSNTYGKTTSRTYDDTIGLVTKEKIENTGLGAYTRYVYGSDGITLDTYSTVVDANGDSTIDTSDEVRTTTLFDGAGRVRKSRTDNPNSTGTFTGQLTEYDILGRLKRSTVPTEINSSWNPAGDDYRGMDGSAYIWLWNGREYDWKGRVTREINTDNTDRLFSYEGCGCAGGQVTTIKGEVTEAVDVAGTLQTTKRRTQKIFADILGRTVKTELWDLDGGGSAPYGTIVNTFNGRDQATLTRQYSGSDSSSTYQDTTMTYDGHGRLLTKHMPVQSSGAYNSFTYNADDTVATATDPRGSVTTNYYGHIDDSASSEYRALLTKVSYAVPGGSGIYVPGNMTYEYDAAGNRTSMGDDTGTLAYSYDELSRLKLETKNFTDAPSNTPSGGYVLSYNYHLTGDLKSIEDPFGSVVTYASDKAGRTTAVGGSGFYAGSQEITSYASGIGYRAFGDLKAMAYSTTTATNVSVGYDTRLRPSTYVVEAADPIHDRTYTYNNDGNVKEAADELEESFSQFNDYDFTGRLKRNEFGTGSPGTGKPFKQTLSYDAFDNITARNTKAWDHAASNFTASYTNHRKTSGSYDAAGNLTYISQGSHNYSSWIFDGAGRIRQWSEHVPFSTGENWAGATNTYDGDGRVSKRVDRTGSSFQTPNTVEQNKYVIFSSVTGDKIADLDSAGDKEKGYVYFGGAVIAEQWKVMSAYSLYFRNSDPITGSMRTIDGAGEILPHADIWRTDVGGLDTAVPMAEEEVYTPAPSRPHGSAFNAEWGCVTDGILGDCSALENGTGVQCPNNDCNPRHGTINGKPAWAIVYATMSGIGYLPFGDYQQTGNGGLKPRKKKRQKPTLKRRPKTAPKPKDTGTGNNEDEGQSQGQSSGTFDYWHLPDEGGTEAQILAILSHAATGECTKAFEAADLTPPKDQYKNLIIVTENVVKNPEWDSFWARGTDVGQHLRDELAKHPNTNDVTPNTADYGGSGNRFMGLTNRALSESDDYLDVTVVHALIHSAGVGAGPDDRSWWDKNIWGVKHHDLSYLGKQYHDIIKACTAKGSKALKDYF